MERKKERKKTNKQINIASYPLKRTYFFFNKSVTRNDCRAGLTDLIKTFKTVPSPCTETISQWSAPGMTDQYETDTPSRRRVCEWTLVA